MLRNPLPQTIEIATGECCEEFCHILVGQLGQHFSRQFVPAAEPLQLVQHATKVWRVDTQHFHHQPLVIGDTFRVENMKRTSGELRHHLRTGRFWDAEIDHATP